MTADPQVISWRAIEALRAGVPNRDAVQALGSSQSKVEDRFEQLLTTAQRELSNGTAAEGFLFAGDFGAGKSHLMEYLQHRALESDFVCSKVIISKETPLYDPSKLYASAIKSGKAPGSVGRILSAVSKRLDFQSKEYQEFDQWLNNPDNGISPYFAASAFIFQQGKGGRYPEISDRILRFWGGSRVPEREMRVWLEELDEPAKYPFDKVSERDLVWQRYQFTSKLIAAAGYAGWIVLVDEVELIGRYSLMQRAKSYGVMARLMRITDHTYVPGLSTVFALTSAYQAEVMDERRDEQKIASRLRGSGEKEALALADYAERTMQKIRQIPQEDMVLLEAVDLPHIYEKCRSVYSQAYNWEAPSSFETQGAWRIRQHIKKWINTWDLQRLFQESDTHVWVSDLKESYSEDTDMETLGQSAPGEKANWESNGAKPEHLLPMELESHIRAEAQSGSNGAWSCITFKLFISTRFNIDSTSGDFRVLFRLEGSEGVFEQELGLDNVTVTKTSGVTADNSMGEIGETYAVRLESLNIRPGSKFEMCVIHPKTEKLLIQRKLPPRFTQEVINLN